MSLGARARGAAVKGLLCLLVGAAPARSSPAPGAGRPEELRRLAAAGDAKAQSALGDIYAEGRGVPKDFKEAVKWYLMADARGDLNAQRKAGRIFAEGRRGVAADGPEALRLLLRAAKKGDVESWGVLAWLYSKGRGVERDEAEAARWLSKVADSGDVAAQRKLAWRYETGLGVGVDCRAAAKWYRKAAEQDDNSSMHALGRLYEGGLGVRRSDRKAADWYLKAAREDYPDAQYRLGVMYAEGRGVRRDLREALRWTRRAAAYGHAGAQSRLGWMYLTGTGVAKDPRKASEWLGKAAAQGDQDARRNLDYVSSEGKGAAAGDETVVLNSMNTRSVKDAKIPSTSRGRRSRQRSIKGPAGIEWVTISGGSFMMGSEDWGPVHRVTVQSFQMAKTEVTVAQYKACVKAGACTPPNGGSKCRWTERGWTTMERENHPVGCVGWNQAEEFSRWAGGRLPSEAEWEYAARSGGKDRRYPWGNEEAACDRAVLAVSSGEGNECGRSGYLPVCSKNAGNTEQGLCDMAGNVWEWTQDWYHHPYAGAPADGSPWESPGGSSRVIRGGSWGDFAASVQATHRGGAEPSDVDERVGFRPVRRLAK
ncbi:MAG: SUMF1/EgtB/PvdO family nonheme iron enzyme [Elusimicrobia bacterium]|nr:SUMF1/EgtB/PvdO family nonheme iron enzyme [Elusimicrobiota bacterium]